MPEWVRKTTSDCFLPSFRVTVAVMGNCGDKTG